MASPRSHLKRLSPQLRDRFTTRALTWSSPPRFGWAKPLQGGYMRTLLRAGVVAVLLAGFTGSAEAQLRAVGGAGLSVPVGDFADEAGGAAKAGGGTAFLGAEWMP